MLSRLSQLPNLRKLSSGSAAAAANGFSSVRAQPGNLRGLASASFFSSSHRVGVASSCFAGPACPPRHVQILCRHPPTSIASLLTRNGVDGRMIRRLSSAAAATSNSATATATATVVVERIPIPSNLHLDPRSSFASRVRTAKPSRGESFGRAAASTPSDKSDEHDDDEEEIDDFDDDLDTDEMVSVLERELKYVTPLPDRLRVSVQDVRDGSVVGSIWLNETVFGRDPIRIDLLKRAVDYHRAKKRGRRNAATKTISEVSGSGRKLRQQKGTGRARVGHGRPPHFRGGAKAHGPKNETNYGHTKLNKKVRKQALCHALSQKLKENNVVLLNDLNVPTHKTKDFSRILHHWNVGGDAGNSSASSSSSSALILDHYFPDEAAATGVASVASASDPPSYRGVPANLHVASRNIPRIMVGNANKANVYELLRKDKLVLTLEALAVLERRLKDY